MLERNEMKNEMFEQGRSIKKKNKELKEATALLVGVAFMIVLLFIFR